MRQQPALVTLHVWGVDATAIPGSLWRMASQLRSVRTFPGATFAKLLGTGSGARFTVRDADPRHWALLTCWDAAQASHAFERSRIVRRWNDASTERLRIDLEPLSCSGRWSGREPFGTPSVRKVDGPVAALTRARLRARKATSFWRSVPPVTSALHRSPGLLLTLGIGEAPIALQGTFSVWESVKALESFAYDTPEHQKAIRQTHETGWYAEELFARFAVLESTGCYHGKSLEGAS